MIDLLDLAAELVDVPSESHEEGPLADLFEKRLRDASQLVVDRIGDNVVARSDLGHKHRIVIAGHLDTVPANGNQHARIEGDRLFGLGACDMKGGLAAQLATAIAIDKPKVDVTFVFYSGEEVAAKYNGLKQLFETHPKLVDGDVALLGEPTSAAIEAGCQGTLRVKALFEGQRAHTARPWKGRNAIHRLGPVLQTLEQYEGRRPVVDGCEYREAMQAVYVEAGVAGNVVPDAANLTVNYRYAPDRTPEQAEAHVAEVLGEYDQLIVDDHALPAMPALTHPLLRQLISRNNLEVRAKLGWTDVARFAVNGIPASNFGSGDASIAHTQGEFVERHEIELVHSALMDLLNTGVS
ncbi:MAG: succinyl-diaminopimelate desuccinylase [Acidimicrobiales bacterium]|nr:succinyl-diaminopimelate desuccinylase [Acidimicrobiales bacterium]RPH19080.1 MAG: succinyl-diaminopimelate desuccinylase [Actinobacteria bacterium TMED270]